MKRIFFLFAAICFTFVTALGQDVTPGPDRAPQPDESVAFAVYDTLSLEMDFYFPNDDAESHPCIIYSYGGGFIMDNQRHEETRTLCRRLADDGSVVIAANYRLGLRGVQFKGPLRMIKPLENAVSLATEDVMKVTRYAWDYADELGIDRWKIILMGSSAGAIASLQCDFERCSQSELAARYLPEGFRYAGVIAFSGAIFSRRGLEYTHDMPAPTLFLHGTADRLVPYKKITFFGTGFYGSSSVAKSFSERHYPHKIMRFTGEGHTVAARYFANYDDVLWFIDHMVKEAHHYEIDETISDPFRERPYWDTAEPDALYK